MIYAFKNVSTEELYSNQKVEFQVKELVYKGDVDKDLKLLTTDFKIDFRERYFSGKGYDEVKIVINQIKIKIDNSFFNTHRTSSVINLYLKFEIESFELIKFRGQKIILIAERDVLTNNGISKLIFSPVSKMTKEEAKACINSLKKSKDISLIVTTELK